MAATLQRVAAASQQHAFDATAARDHFNEADEAQSVEWFIEAQRDGELLFLEHFSHEDLHRHLPIGHQTARWSFHTERRFAHRIPGTRRAHAIAEFLRAMHPGWSVRVTTTGGI
jgi:hypothetical protein